HTAVGLEPDLPDRPAGADEAETCEYVDLRARRDRGRGLRVHRGARSADGRGCVTTGTTGEIEARTEPVCDAFDLLKSGLAGVEELPFFRGEASDRASGTCRPATWARICLRYRETGNTQYCQHKYGMFMQIHVSSFKSNAYF